MNERILLWDTETYGMGRLSGDNARILVLAWKWFGEKKSYSTRIDDFRAYKNDPTNDLGPIKEFELAYKEAHMTVAHYGSGFDLPQMNTRRLIHGLKPLPPSKMYDTWYVLKKTFNLKSNSLKNASTAFNLKHKKMEVSWRVWDKAAAGHKPSMDTLDERCVADIVEMEELFGKIRPWMPQYMPNVYAVIDKATQCGVCGFKGKMSLGGPRPSKTHWFQQYQCPDCGAWQPGKKVMV